MAYILHGQHLLKQFHLHKDKKKKKNHFAKKQEEARKDVERVFRVLQSHFAIVHGPIRLFQIETLKDIMTACIILHNMIIEDEHHIDGVGRVDYEKFNATTLDPVSHYT
jgi:hypothetical protein